MRTGLFADIHANREALEACLDHAKSQNIDRYLFLGDLVGYGADPEWVIETVMSYHEQGAISLLGNHDEAVIMRNPVRSMHGDARVVIDWTRERLSAVHVAFLASLPVQVREDDRLYVHANAWDPAGWGYVMDVMDAEKSLSATACSCTFCGHLHLPFLYHQSASGMVKLFSPVPGVDTPISSRRRWLALIGSVGQPRDGNPAGCYAIHDLKRKMLTYHRVPFDAEKASAKIHEAGLPAWFGSRLVMGY